MEIQFTTQIFKEGKMFVAHARELDVSSCGRTEARALDNLKEAGRLFLEEAEKAGSLEAILEEAGYRRAKARLQGPKLISVQRVSMPLPLVHAKGLARFPTNTSNFPANRLGVCVYYVFPILALGLWKT